MRSKFQTRRAIETSATCTSEVGILSGSPDGEEGAKTEPKEGSVSSGFSGYTDMPFDNVMIRYRWLEERRIEVVGIAKRRDLGLGEGEELGETDVVECDGDTEGGEVETTNFDST